MAVVGMKKFRLVGLSSEKEKIIDKLLRCGAAQLTPTEETELTVRNLEGETLDEAASVYSRACVALDFLGERLKACRRLVEKKILPRETLAGAEKKTLLFVRTAVSADDFERVDLQKEELFAVCEGLEKLAAEKTELKTRFSALGALGTGLQPYREFRMKFSELQPTRHVRFLLGTCKKAASLQRDVHAMSEKYGAEIQIFPVKDLRGKVREYLLFAAVEKERAQGLDADLAVLGFAPCPYDFDCTADEKLREIRREREEIRRAEEKLEERAAAYFSYEKPLRLLADCYRLRMELIRADGDFAKTAKTFILECFVPAPDAERVEKAIYAATENVVLDVRDAEDRDCPPTLLKNNAFVAPYESITNTFSPPSYRETDPNPVVAIFYVIFFGIMFGDAGYGLVLAVGSFLAVRLLKPEKSMRNLLLIFGMGGISAIIWGILFGGVFSIDTVQPLWFAPLSDPIIMLILCFALGLLQIFVGMGYQAHELIKGKHIADAVYDVFSWYAIFLGGGLAALSLLLVPAFPVWIGVAILAAGVAVLMFGGAVRAKGVFGRIFGAVSPLYGIVNYFSDVMSYSRLFGLALASGVIGLVFNTLAEVFIGLIPVAGYVLAAILLLVGHGLNLAIGLLGAYVHDSRLQYIEFFGRFYHGGGRLFVPLGSNLKYVTIKQEV